MTNATKPPTVSSPVFEHHPDGLGVGYSNPRISWRFSDPGIDVKDWEQSAYEIEILRQTDKKESYHVQSSESVLVPWPSQPLQSRERVSVRVRAFPKGSNDDVTHWSAWSTVEAALLSRSDWTAKVISGPPQSDGALRPVLFRKEFALPEQGDGIASARLYITSLGVYEAYVNGVRVGDHYMAPGWTSYNYRLNYQTFDVKSLLQKGENVIAVEVGEGWYASRLTWEDGRRYLYGKDQALLAQLELRSGLEGAAETWKLNSDTSWKCSQSPRLTSEIYDGEVYDHAQEPKGWNSPGSLPKDGWTDTRELEFPKAKLVAPDAPPVRITEELEPVSIFKSKSGKTLIDFGQNLVGTLLVGSLTKPKGHRVSFTHAEVLDNGEIGTRPLRSAKAKDTIICSGSELTKWSPHFTFHGFRYVEVEGWTPDDESNPLSKASIKALVLHTDLQRTGWFYCSNALVNKLHDNALWSMRGNFFSIPTDCPQRDERLGWTGDIEAFCPSAAFLYDTAGMLGNWLEDVAVEQEQSHSVPGLVVPNVLSQAWGSNPQAVWCDAAVLVPWTLYRASGDLEILQRQYHSMRTWIDHGVRRGPDQLWDPHLWQLGDWLDPTAPADDPGRAQTDGTLVADAFLVHITSIMSQISTLVNRPDDHKRYTSEHGNLKALFQKKYMSPSGLVIGDTQTAYAMALVFSLHENDEQVAIAAERLSRLVRYANFRIACGFAGTPLITHALSSTGHHQLAYRMLLEKKCPSWLYPVLMGATTIWERWDSMLPDGSINPGQMTSFNHYALGAVVNWLHEYVGGISPLDAGWKKIQVRPAPGGNLTTAEARYESPYGTIRSSWEIKDGNEFELSLLIPPNSRAWVIMPDNQRKKVGGEPEEGFWVGSGKYVFRSRLEKDEDWPPKPLLTGFAQAKDNYDDDIAA